MRACTWWCGKIPAREMRARLTPRVRVNVGVCYLEIEIECYLEIEIQCYLEIDTGCDGGFSQLVNLGN